jgi:hypothetical protein
LALACNACGARSLDMRVVEALDVASRDRVARVVFVRDSVDVNGTLVPILDEVGNLLGELEADSAFATDLVEGRHRFVTATDPAVALDADLRKGRTYFVDVEVRFGARSPRFELRPVPKAEVADARMRAGSCTALELVLEPPAPREDASEKLREAETWLSVGSPSALLPGDGLAIR